MKSTLTRVTLLSLAVGAALGFATCRVNLGDDLKYTCAADSDCGGSGYVCAVGPTQGICCLPSGPDTQCDQTDNDCDGFVDNTGKSETCNGEDDDCDGKIDENFDLTSDPNNCGMCKKVCGIQEPCIKSVCIPRREINCFDGFDDDDNGKIDCDDPACELRQCGAACLCQALKKTEALCSDSTDNDGDLALDCADTDCVDKSCGTGCLCVTDGGRKETACDDNLDNDGDGDGGLGHKDCDDDDCLGQFCTPPQLFFTCSPRKPDGGSDCKCNNGVQIAEVGSVFCRDNIDNDCNGVKDCRELTCAGQSCAPDAGITCQCTMGLKKEMDCTNGLDDDGDLAADCADSDCPQGTPCNGGAGTCTPGKTCQ